MEKEKSLAKKKSKCMCEMMRFYLVRYAMVGVFVVLITAFGILSPQFLTAETLRNILWHMSISAIVALGVTFVAITGKWDISFGGTAGLATMTTCYLITLFGEHATAWAILVGLAIGLAVGGINGILVVRFGLPDLLTTLATYSLAFGLSFLPGGGYELHHNLGKSFAFLFNGMIGPIPFITIFVSLIYCIAYLILHRSRFGRAAYAIGMGEQTALFSGISVQSIRLSAYVLCGSLAAFGGILTASEHMRAWVLLSQGYLLRDFAALFLGISLFGRPTVYGTWLGAFFLTTVRTGLVLCRAPYHVSDVLTGALLLTAISIGIAQAKRR